MTAVDKGCGNGYKMCKAIEVCTVTLYIQN